MKEDIFATFSFLPFTLYSTHNIHFYARSDLKHDAKRFLFFSEKRNFFRKHKARVEKRHLRHVYYYYLHSCHLRFHRREMGKRRKTFFFYYSKFEIGFLREMMVEFWNLMKHFCLCHAKEFWFMVLYKVCVKMCLNNEFCWTINVIFRGFL